MTTPAQPVPPVPAGLYTNPDARAWAAHFSECLKANPLIAHDEDCMVCWFANAMMAIHDTRPAQSRDAGSPAARDVLAERERQKPAEEWTEAHDDEHVDGSLAIAAGCYALGNRQSFHDSILNDRFRVPDLWPQSWNSGWWNPKDRRHDLVRAAALIIAEIERLDRAAPPTAQEGKT